MKYFRIICLLLLLFGFFLENHAFGQVKMPEIRTVAAWGEANLTESPATDRERAIAQAQRKAVEQVVGIYVLSKTLVRNAELVEDKIYTKAEGFINNYEVIRQERQEVQRVHIRAKVSLLPVTDILKKSGLLRQWRVGVLITPERRIMSTLLRYYSQTRLMEVANNIEAGIGRSISEAGFKLVDPRHLNKLRKSNDPESVLGADFGGDMDLFVTGSVSLASRKTSGSLNQAICQIHAKALRVDTGEIIYQENVGNTFDGTTLLTSPEIAEKYMDSHGNGQLSDGTPDLRTFGQGDTASLDKAIQLASVMTADSVVSQIMRIPAASRSIVIIEVHNMEFEEFVTLEDLLKQFDGVASVTNQGFGDGAKSFEIEYDGKAMTLARALSKSKLAKNIGLKVKGVTQNKIVLKK